MYAVEQLFHNDYQHTSKQLTYFIKTSSSQDMAKPMPGCQLFLAHSKTLPPRNYLNTHNGTAILTERHIKLSLNYVVVSSKPLTSLSSPKGCLWLDAWTHNFQNDQSATFWPQNLTNSSLAARKLFPEVVVKYHLHKRLVYNHRHMDSPENRMLSAANRQRRNNKTFSFTK